MKSLTITTPDTLMLSVYFEAKHCGIKGIVRDGAGTMIDDALQYYGYGLASAIGAALSEGQSIGARHCLIACNHTALVKVFTPPIKLSLPETKTVTVKPTKYESMQLGMRAEKKAVAALGNDNQWNVLRELEGTYKGRWRVLYADSLPGAQSIFERNHRIDIDFDKIAPIAY